MEVFRFYQQIYMLRAYRALFHIDFLSHCATMWFSGIYESNLYKQKSWFNSDVYAMSVYHCCLHSQNSTRKQFDFSMVTLHVYFWTCNYKNFSNKEKILAVKLSNLLLSLSFFVEYYLELHILTHLLSADSSY